jgi:large subunit ribosomal protein L7/L12
MAEFSEDTKALGDKIVGLTLLQAKELSDYLKEVYGIEPASGGAMVVAAAPAAAAEEAPKGPQKVNVILTAVGAASVQVIKAVKEITGAGLMDAKKLVGALPATIKENLDLAEAEKIKAQLVEAGASVELK